MIEGGGGGGGGGGIRFNVTFNSFGLIPMRQKLRTSRKFPSLTADSHMHQFINPSNAKATFVISTRTLRFL